MRRTVITRMDAVRDVPYDPDDHTILDRRGQLNASVAIRKGGGELQASWRFLTDYLEQGTDKRWGHVGIQAVTIVKDDRLVPDIGPGGELDLAPGILKVLEGAFADEVLLPASVLVRGMRLPGLLMSPVSIDSVTGTDVDSTEEE